MSQVCCLFHKTHPYFVGFDSPWNQSETGDNGEAEPKAPMKELACHYIQSKKDCIEIFFAVIDCRCNIVENVVHHKKDKVNTVHTKHEIAEKKDNNREK